MFNDVQCALWPIGFVSSEKTKMSQTTESSQKYYTSQYCTFADSSDYEQQ